MLKLNIKKLRFVSLSVVEDPLTNKIKKDSFDFAQDDIFFDFKFVKYSGSPMNY